MSIKTIIQFHECEVELTNLEKDIKNILKEKNIKQKDITDINVYVKPEATYVVVECFDKENVEFRLYEK